MVYSTYLWRFGGWFIIVLPTIFLLCETSQSPPKLYLLLPNLDSASLSCFSTRPRLQVNSP
jgi:hypothetical protein